MSQRDPEYVARAYLDSLWCRRVRKGAYDEPLVLAFMDLLDAPINLDEAGVNGFYLTLLQDVVVPEARKMREFASASPLRDALGIDGERTFFCFASTLLFLREGSNSTSAIRRHFNKCWQNFPDDLQESVENAREWQLKRLRFHLMPNERLRFLASFRLMSNGEADAGPVGYGSQREGRTGYSHFAREVVLFALLDALFRGEFLDAVTHLAASTDDRETLSVSDPELDALFDYVLIPIAIDLAKVLVKRRTWRPDSASRSDPKTGESHIRNAAVSVHNLATLGDQSKSDHNEFLAQMDQILSPGERPDLPLTRAKEELIELWERYAWTPGVDMETLSKRIKCIDSVSFRDSRSNDRPMKLGEFRERAETSNQLKEGRRGVGKQPKSLGENKDAERISRPLLEGDPRVQRIYDGVCLVIQHACLSVEKDVIWRYRKANSRVVRATLDEMLRLWFGLQLLSMLRDVRYPANAVDRFLNDLKAIFQPLEDDATGDALAVAEYASDGKQIFGQKFVTKRNQLIDSALTVISSMFIEERRLDIVYDHLEALKKHEGALGPIPTVKGKGAISLIALAAWVVVAHQRANGSVAELESLYQTLCAQFETQPYTYLSDGLTELSSFVEFPTGVDTRSRNGLQAAKVKLEELLGGIRHRSSFGDSEQLRAYLTAMIVVKLIDDCIAMPDPPDWSVDRAGIRRFFSRKYADDLQHNRSEQEAWLYVAFKLANTDGFAAYRDVYERVSRHVGEWHWGGCRLSALYRDLIALHDFQRDTWAVFESLFPLHGDHA